MSKKKETTESEELMVVSPPLAPPDTGNPNNRQEEQNDEGASSIYKKNRYAKRARIRKRLKENHKTRSVSKKDLMLLQGSVMAGKLASGEAKSITQLAEQYKFSPPSIKRRLDIAKQNDIIQLAKEIISEKLLPKALAVIERELSAGNYEAAKDVLFGLQVLQKGGKATVEHISNGIPSLEQIRSERMAKLAIDVTPINEEKEQE